MSFFDDFPQPPPSPAEPARRPPEPWEGPPPGVIGGWVPWRIVLARSEKAYAVLRDFEAFPSGLHFELVTHFKEEDGTGTPMRMRLRPRMGDAEALRIGVRFADGRKAATRRGPEERVGDPTHPILRPGGGGGSRGTWRMSYWLWPLPPPGPLTWVSQWPDVGVGETSVEVDASVLGTAAAEAEQLWEEDEGGVGRGYTRVTRVLRASSEGRESPAE